MKTRKESGATSTDWALIIAAVAVFAALLAAMLGDTLTAYINGLTALASQ